jgi:hypothetical protein
MVPATWLGTARRLTILLFTRTGDGSVRRQAVARYAVGDWFPAAWDPATQPDQLKRLGELLAEADPQRIGLDFSRTFPLADGLTAGSRDAVLAALPPELVGRIVSAEAARDRLARDAHARGAGNDGRSMPRVPRLPEAGFVGRGHRAWPDHDRRRRMVAAGHRRHCRARILVSSHRQRPARGGNGARGSFASPPPQLVIMPGDLVHIDFGIVADGYCTDQQQHGYVLRPGETVAPDGLRLALARANRLQELLMAQFAVGSTGNDVLRSTLEDARAEGLDALVYTHPIGLHGHAAGPSIGLWDKQNGVPGQGDYAVHPSTAYSIELQVRTATPDWDGQIVQAMLEEDAWFDGETCAFLDGRQTELWLI